MELQKKVKVLQQRHRRHLDKLLGLESTVCQLRQSNLLNEERLQLLERVQTKQCPFNIFINKMVHLLSLFFSRRIYRQVQLCQMLVRLWLSSTRRTTQLTSMPSQILKRKKGEGGVVGISSQPCLTTITTLFTLPKYC